IYFFFFQAEDGIRDRNVTGVQTCALPIYLCEGWLEGYLLTRRHGLFATYEAFAMVSASMAVQHTKWLEAGIALPWRAPIASLNRSEERRVGKECRSRRWPCDGEKNRVW